MKYFNYKWKKYIDENWSFYVKYPSFFSYHNSNNIQCYDGEYDIKLVEEFNKYFDAKKEYVSKNKEHKENFGSYEEIKINDYDTELSDYKKRVDVYSKELSDTICNLVGKNNFQNFKDIDFKLLLLGYADTKNYLTITQHFSKIFNKANSFLSGYLEYFDFLKTYIPSSILDASFHDGRITEINKNGNVLTVIIEDGNWPYDKTYHLKFINVNTDNIDRIELNQNIISNSLYYQDKKYYYYIEISDNDIYEFVSDDIELEIISK